METTVFDLRGDSVTIGEGGPSPARVAAVTQKE